MHEKISIFRTEESKVIMMIMISIEDLLLKYCWSIVQILAWPVIFELNNEKNF